MVTMTDESNYDPRHIYTNSDFNLTLFSLPSLTSIYSNLEMKPIKGGILALASTTLAAPTSKPTCSSLSSVSLTFYGYPDNDPPSADIAWDCGRGYKAGGKLFTIPLTFHG